MTRNVGQLGEALLTKWAAEVSAAINKAVIDRTGWDFLVEFAINVDIPSRPLDLIPSPLQCLIQVKSTDTSSRRVRTSLTNWLRLVRSPLPTFFLVLHFDNSPNCTRAYLTHVGEHLMYRTLRRLRSISTKATPSALGRLTQSYTVPADDQLPACDGAALAKALHTHVQPDFDAYVADKRQLLESLGYEQASKQLQFTVRVPESHARRHPADLLVDFAIGTVHELEVTQGTVTDVRFGIPAPKPDVELVSGTLSIQHNLGPHRVVAAARLKGRTQAMGDIPTTEVIVPIDQIEPAEKWVLFRDEPLPRPVTALLDAVAEGCEDGTIIVRLDHETVTA